MLDRIPGTIPVLGPVLVLEEVPVDQAFFRFALSVEHHEQLGLDDGVFVGILRVLGQEIADVEVGVSGADPGDTTSQLDEVASRRRHRGDDQDVGRLQVQRLQTSIIEDHDVVIGVVVELLAVGLALEGTPLS